MFQIYISIAAFIALVVCFILSRMELKEAYNAFELAKKREAVKDDCIKHLHGKIDELEKRIKTDICCHTFTYEPIQITKPIKKKPAKKSAKKPTAKKDK